MRLLLADIHGDDVDAQGNIDIVNAINKLRLLLADLHGDDVVIGCARQY